jgi:hypothetical protein
VGLGVGVEVEVEPSGVDGGELVERVGGVTEVDMAVVKEGEVK